MARVRVAVRVRPQNDAEKARSSSSLSTLRCADSEIQFNSESASADPSKRFTFDEVFNTDSTQDHVFEAIGKPTIGRVLEGYNGTILAYGQTSSGKTHTMMGPNGGTPELLGSEQRGLVPRIITHLLSSLDARPAAELTWEVSLSVFELYNEELFDLCWSRHVQQQQQQQQNKQQPSTDSSAKALPAADTQPTQLSKPELRIREDRAGGRGVFVEGLVALPIRTAEEALDIMQEASKAKHVGGTKMNETSSRSHTIVQVYVSQVDNVEGGTKTQANLFLVDLAGSERIDKTGAQGSRLKEAQNINLSLTLLGNVINKLTDGKSLHIPYRDSKLTRLLQDSLGGNAMTTLLCACSPSTFNASETLSTLMFANRAKFIENQPIANKELSDDELRKAFKQAQEEIRVLKERLHDFEGVEGQPAVRSSVLTEGNSSSSSATTSEQIAELKATVKSLLNDLRIESDEKMSAEKDAGDAKQRIRFWEERESEALKKAAEWKARYEREKMACDSWARKFAELTNNKAQQPSADPSKKPKPKPPSKRTRSSSAVSKKTESSEPKESPRVEASMLPPRTPPDNDSAPPSTIEEAQAGEMRALVRERMLLQQIDELQEKVERAKKYPIIIERLNRDAEIAHEENRRKLERNEQHYEALLKRQDDEIGSLQLKLDQRIEQSQQLKNTSAQGSAELDRLRMENEVLHEENKSNGQRLLDFAKRVEKLSQELSAAKDEKDRLVTEIEKSNLNAEMKTKILGSKLQSERSAFRRRLLDCFATDEK